MNNNDYKKKYIKYKNKYLNSKLNQKDKLSQSNNYIKAIAFFNNEDIKGCVQFEEVDNNQVLVKVNLQGFISNSIHGFHVHEYGDLSDGCNSMCAHFNPHNKEHGGREDIERHVGDLGNLEADDEGKVNIEFLDNFIKLRGDIENIIGRGLIIHEDKDDCGKGNYPDSKITGHSGKRIACSIIGYSSVY